MQLFDIINTFSHATFSEIKRGSSEFRAIIQSCPVYDSLAPSNLAASNSYGNTVNLSWTSGYMGSYGAGNGEIIGYTDTSGNTQYIDVTSVANQYAVTGLATASSYTFTVASAVFPSGGAGQPLAISASSNSASASTGPDAPTGLSYTLANPGEVDLSWTSPTCADSIEVVRTASNGQSQQFYLNSTQMASNTFADTNIPAGDVTLNYYLYAFYNGIMSSSSSNGVSVPLAPTPYQMAVGQTIEEDLNLGGQAQPGDTAWIGTGTGPTPVSVASLADADNTVYGGFYPYNMAQVTVDSNGMADILVTGASDGNGTVNVYNGSDQTLVSVAQQVMTPTLVVTAADATKGGADGAFNFQLLDPSGNPYTATVAITVSYTISGTAALPISLPSGA